MTDYLPTPHNLAGAAGLALTLLLFLLVGATATARRALPEVQLLAGWGLACLVLTAWAVVTPASLRLPLAALAALGLACFLRPAWRRRIGPLGDAGRLLALTLPLWLVMLPARPSQIDTWLNLLPNAAYLFTYDMLPTALRPPSYSFLPVAPYNTQFVAYAASVASGGFADSAMALFSIALQCAAALLLARVVAGRDTKLPWWACAVGLLLAVPLNPGFVPREFFASYGEAPLAVVTLFAVWLSVELIESLASGIDWPRATPALALVLAALVNVKQSGIGLLLPIGVTLLLLVLAHPRIPRRRGVAVVLVTLTPGLALYLLWRVFAMRSFVAGELQPLPVAAWNFALLPQIFASMGRTMLEKATFFLCLAAVLGAWVRACRHTRWDHASLLLAMIAGVSVLFNGFLVFTYIALFPGIMAAQAHSYFRYASQLSLLVMLGLVIAFRPVVARWVVGLGHRARHLALGSIVVVLLMPILLRPALRFDLDPPQRELWQLGHRAALFVAPGDKLALLVPGDVDDSVGSMLRGVLMFTPPARPRLDLKTATTADAATLAALAASGYRLALVSCTPPGLDDVPAHVAAMLRYGDGGWQTLRAWPYPAALSHQHFAALLARAPLCAAG